MHIETRWSMVDWILNFQNPRMTVLRGAKSRPISGAICCIIVWYIPPKFNDPWGINVWTEWFRSEYGHFGDLIETKFPIKPSNPLKWTQMDSNGLKFCQQALGNHLRQRSLRDPAKTRSAFLIFLLGLLALKITWCPSVSSQFLMIRLACLGLRVFRLTISTFTITFRPLVAANNFNANKRRLSIHLRMGSSFESVVSKTVNFKNGANNFTRPFKRSCTNCSTDRPHWKYCPHVNCE